MTFPQVELGEEARADAGAGEDGAHEIPPISPVSISPS
jgi:hypothetical protein